MNRNITSGLIGLAIGWVVQWFAPPAVRAVFIVVAGSTIIACMHVMIVERDAFPRATARRKGGW